MTDSRAEYTDRPLTDDERKFSEDNHDLIFKYMKVHQLDPEEWYDILVIPYLQAVKKYHTYEYLREFKFIQICYRTLDNARSNYFRYINQKKRCPEGGIFSYDDLLEGEDGSTFGKYLIDVYTNVEKQVVLKELFSEFYNKCVACEFWATDIRKTELDMLIEGYTMRQILSAIKNNSCDDGLYSWALDNDIEKFRKIFKEVFGI